MNKKIIGALATIVVLAVAVGGHFFFYQNKSTVPIGTKTTYKTFRSADYSTGGGSTKVGYTIEYPQTWNVKEDISVAQTKIESDLKLGSNEKFTKEPAVPQDASPVLMISHDSAGTDPQSARYIEEKINSEVNAVKGISKCSIDDQNYKVQGLPGRRLVCITNTTNFATVNLEVESVYVIDNDHYFRMDFLKWYKLPEFNVSAEKIAEIDRDVAHMFASLKIETR